MTVDHTSSNGRPSGRVCRAADDGINERMALAATLNAEGMPLLSSGTSPAPCRPCAQRYHLDRVAGLAYSGSGGLDHPSFRASGLKREHGRYFLSGA